MSITPCCNQSSHWRSTIASRRSAAAWYSASGRVEEDIVVGIVVRVRVDRAPSAGAVAPKIRCMNSRMVSRRATSVALALVAFGAVVGLCACGQKGPLYLPAPATPAQRAHVPSAPDDSMPSLPPLLPPSPGASTPGLPTPVT
ncbi:MAG TPA: lipoprotein [Burkholderiaceae bacterium]|nr:lipoprotein [Burkholderiaceae bacterium]